MPKELRMYSLPSGEQPFHKWLHHLKDIKIRARIRARLDRLLLGNYGNYKSLGKGIYELRLDFGSGYRIYFGELGKYIVLLLCGGDKSTQKRDIEKARDYWQKAKGETYE